MKDLIKIKYFLPTYYWLYKVYQAKHLFSLNSIERLKFNLMYGSYYIWKYSYIKLYPYNPYNKVLKYFKRHANVSYRGRHSLICSPFLIKFAVGTRKCDIKSRYQNNENAFNMVSYLFWALYTSQVICSDLFLIER